MTDKAYAALVGSGMTDEAFAVASMMVLPGDFPPIRVADTYSADETAITQVKNRSKVTWPSGSALTPSTSRLQLDPDLWACFAFPSLLRHRVNYVVLNETGTPSGAEYDAIFDLTTMSTTYTMVPGVFALDPTLMTFVTGAYAPQGQTYWCGKGDGRVGIWLDASPTGIASFGLNAISPANFCEGLWTITIRRFYAGDWMFYGKTTFNTTGSGSPVYQSCDITHSGYYNVEVTWQPGDLTLPTGNQMEFKLRAFSQMASAWRHNSATDLNLNISSINAARALGLSVLVQNEASVMNRQGNIIGLQCPAGTDWQTYYGGSTSAVYSQAFQDQRTKSFLLEKGIYGFKRPKSVQDFNFEYDIFSAVPIQNPNSTATSLTYIKAAWFPLMCPCDFLMVAASASAAGAGDCVLTTSLGIEYRSSNSWLETTTPVISRQAFEMGIASLREFDQWYENPIHWGSLAKNISKALTTIAPVLGLVPGVGGYLSTGANIGGKAIAALQEALDEDGNEDTEMTGNPVIARGREKMQRLASLKSAVNNGAIARAAIRGKKRGRRM